MSMPILRAMAYQTSEFEGLSKEMAAWHAQINAIEEAHYDEEFTSEERELSDVAYTITDKMCKRLIKPEKSDLVVGALDVKGRLQGLAIFSFSIDFSHKCLLHYIVTHPSNLPFQFQLKNRIAGAAGLILQTICKIAKIHHPEAEVHAQAYGVSLAFFAKNNFVKHLSKPEGLRLTPVVLKNEELLKLCPKEEKAEAKA